MNYRDILEDLFKKNNGLLLTQDIVKGGISKQLLGKYVKMGYLERVAHGVYLSKDALLDDMYVIQARSKKSVFSHESALFLHDLTDRDPLSYTITLPSGYNASQYKQDGIKVYYVKSNLLDLGIEEGKTIFGRTIRVYNKERTVCDIIRNRSNMDSSVLNESIKRYLKTDNINISLLMKYAKLFNIDKILRYYLEVLL